MTDDERKPWDQLDNEPDRAYARFLVYLHLGPSRSIDRAFHVASKRTTGRAGGAWSADSTMYNWPSRATAYDINVLAPKLGTEVVINWSIAAGELSKQLLDEIREGKLRPRNFDQVLELFNVLSSLITPETLKAVQQSVGSFVDSTGEEEQ